MVWHVALALGVPTKDARQFAQAAVLHDIGKLAVPIEILQKSTPLSQEEFALIRTHSSAGHGILQVAGSSTAKLAAEIALNHHERFDGSGYPRGLSGEAISLPAQITAICDTYDALRQDRPYRRGITHDKAVSVITMGDDKTKPGHFAPKIVEAFMNVSDEMWKSLGIRTWLSHQPLEPTGSAL